MTLAFDAAAAIACSNEKAASNGLLEYETGDTNTCAFAANWHIVRPWPGNDGTAVAHLVARRFGVYKPGFKYHYWGSDNAPRIGWKNLFPGYIFIRAWNILKQADRICACPGVGSILYQADEPFIVPEDFIQQLRELEADEYLEREKVFEHEFLRRYTTRTGNRRKKRKKHRLSHIQLLDEAARNQVMRKWLGLV